MSKTQPKPKSKPKPNQNQNDNKTGNTKKTNKKARLNMA